MAISVVGIVRKLSRWKPSPWQRGLNPMALHTGQALHLSSRLLASQSEYTHIIVGAGSAGCVLANRLSAEPANKILLLEAGSKDFSWKIRMPAAWQNAVLSNSYNWHNNTEPEPHLGNREIYIPAGRVLGGSSSINVMCYVRGHALDFDRWEKEGAEGWSYANCLPYFRRAQTHEFGPDEYRGGDGPLHVSRGKSKNPLYQAFIDAGVQAGYSATDDVNGYQQEGFGYTDFTVHKGVRWSAASAYLHPVMKRKNLTVTSKPFATRVLFEGIKAVGMEYLSKDQITTARASQEVILCAGAINSPQLLMLSGIGDADELRKHNIPVVAHLPGVGQNLQDHLGLSLQYQCTQPITLYPTQFPHNKILIGSRWFLFQSGLGASSHCERVSFIRSQPGVEHPDIQVLFLPTTVTEDSNKRGDCHSYEVVAISLRPSSKGFIKLRSSNPRERPIIQANYLETEIDRETMRQCIRLGRKILQQPAFDQYRGPEIQPGAAAESDEDLDEFVRKTGRSFYHPSCTCRMGSTTDPMTVVDSQTKVLGVENMRVVDASIMPSIVSGNLNAPTIMIAEKAADIILGKEPLPKSKAAVYKPAVLKTQS